MNDARNPYGSIHSRTAAVAALAGLIALLATATAAHATPICFDPQVPPGQIATAVVSKYSKPSRGTCKTFGGWALNYDSSPVTGTACLNSAGDTLRVGYTVHRFDMSILRTTSVILELPYPSLVGGTGRAHEEDSGVSSESNIANAAPCVIGMP